MSAAHSLGQLELTIAAAAEEIVDHHHLAAFPVHAESSAKGLVPLPAGDRTVGNPNKPAAVKIHATHPAVDNLAAGDIHVLAIAHVDAGCYFRAGFACMLQQEAGDVHVPAAGQNNAVGGAAFVFRIVVDGIAADDQVLGIFGNDGLVIAAV